MVAQRSSGRGCLGAGERGGRNGGGVARPGELTGGGTRSKDGRAVLHRELVQGARPSFPMVKTPGNGRDRGGDAREWMG